MDGSRKELSLMEPVSAVERERTMRNLVNVQRKVERRQQRGRERQLLRVRKEAAVAYFLNIKCVVVKRFPSSEF